MFLYSLLPQNIKPSCIKLVLKDAGSITTIFLSVLRFSAIVIAVQVLPVPK